MLNYRDEATLRAQVALHGSVRAACRANTGWVRQTVQGYAKRFGINSVSAGSYNAKSGRNVDGKIGAPEPPGAIIEEATATLIGEKNPLGTRNLTPDDLLRQHGLDPAEWDVRPTVNAWDSLAGDGRVVTLAQLKVSCTRRWEAIVTPPDRAKGWKPRKAAPAARTSKPEYVVVFPDPHAPMNEPALTDASIAWCERFKPSRLIVLGDAADNSPWKRHKKNPRTDCTAQEALESTYELLASWAQAAPNAKREILPGNHDWWLRDRVLESLPALATLKRPGDAFPVLGMHHLLRLDELGYHLHDTAGEYHDVTISVAENLVGMHGTRNGQHGGATKEFALWEGASVIQGHDHKTAMVAMTRRLPDGGESQRYAISAGTMARRDLGYDPAHNCAQSFVVFTIHPDGRWHADLALYDPQRGDTTWRDWRYQPAG